MSEGEVVVKACVIWQIVPPQGIGSRQSPYFRILGEEWFIRLSLFQICNFGYPCKVWLYRRNKEDTRGAAVSVTCHIIAGRQTLSQEGSVQIESETEILNRYVNLSPGDFKKWTVYCHLSSVEPLSLQTDNETIRILTGPSTDRSIHSQWLSDDFSRLLKDEMDPDATLTCGGRTWKVHRSILAVRSEVFAAMFRSGMTESRTGTINVEDLEANVLDSLLKYVYCGEVPELTGRNVSGLYEAGDRYALHGFRKACSDWMVKNLSDENCLSFLITADAHGDTEMKEAVASFVAGHYTDIGEEIWTNFTKEHPFLAVAVLQRLAPSRKK